MRYSKYLLILVAITLSLAACKPASNPTSLEIEESFTLRLEDGYNEIVASDGTKVELLEVNDSRCPLNVECVQAGQALVKLKISEPEKEPREVELVGITPLGDGKSSEPMGDGYLLLLDVKPYPQADKQLEQDEIEVELIWSKNPPIG